MSGETTVTLLAAFAGGFLSFVSPCVLPMIPAYLSFISGISVDELKKAGLRGAARASLVVNAIFFIVGFSAIFISLGAFASSVGNWINVLRIVLLRDLVNGGLTVKFLARPFTADELEQFEQVFRFGILQLGGIIIVIFGLHMLGVIRIPLLYREARAHMVRRSFGYLSSLVAGAAFSLGWTPCVGPILGAILMVAAASDSASQGVILLTAYSAGLAAPFLISAVLVNSLFQWLHQASRFFRFVEITSGVLLIVLGILLFLDKLTALNTYFDALLRWLGIDLTGLEESILR